MSIWTHALNTTRFVPSYSYSSPSPSSSSSSSPYTGPALIASAGVLGYQAIEAAHSHSHLVVTGSCPTVGVAGGFLMGGGHSPLSASFGLAADQALAYRVALADGSDTIVNATPDENPDLYWALSGGAGGGTYGVVLEVALRAYPASPTVGGARIQLAANSTTPESFAAAVAAAHELMPSLADRRIASNYILTRAFFSIGPFTHLGSTGEKLRDEVLRPLTARLRELGIPFSEKYTTYDSYRDHYDAYLGPLPWGTLRSSEYQYGSRLVPRSALVENTDGGATQLQQVIMDLISRNNVTLVATTGPFIPQPPSGGAAVKNSVNPAWRQTMMQLQLSTPWDNDPSEWAAMLRDQRLMSESYLAALRDATPGGASYLNEGDVRLSSDWRAEYFGENYDELRRIKDKWDPDGVFYVFKGVGSEAWTVDESGRMCRAGDW